MAENDPRPDDAEASAEPAAPDDAAGAGDAAPDDTAGGDDGGNGDGNGNGGGNGRNGEPEKRSRMPLVIGAGALLIALAAGAGWWTGLVPDLLGIPVERKEARITLGEPVTFDMPEIKADLKTGACSAPLLKALISVQLLPKDVGRLEAARMRIRDRIIAHLRDVERQELVGKEGTERLRFDIVEIINQEIQPATAHTIFFRDLLLQ